MFLQGTSESSMPSWETVAVSVYEICPEEEYEKIAISLLDNKNPAVAANIG